MKKHTCSANTQVSTSVKTTIKARLIKLGIDVHADSYRVVRQIDHNTPAAGAEVHTRAV